MDVDTPADVTLSPAADALLLRLRIIATDAASKLLHPDSLATELHALADSVARLKSRQATEPVVAPEDDRSKRDAEFGQDVKRLKKAPREFDFNTYQQRHVALEVLYLGWDYQGFARQESTDNTIESQLFKAMRKTRLIAEDVPISAVKYSRCGRTDKGVSALGQVVALMMRSSGRAGQPELAVTSEMDYPRIMNKALPPEIRVLGWTPVPDEFNARFSATYREYKYFIVQQADAEGKAPPRLNIAAMQEAANHFVGEHDFRNFCKPDVAAVRNFRRTILHFRVDPAGLSCQEEDAASGSASAPSAASPVSSIYVLNVRGTAFLWHQVRCMAAVLLMVGQGQEDPGIVAKMLDLNAMPRKPQYQMDPLLLYECGFNGLDLRRTERMASNNMASITAAMEKHLIASAMVSTVRTRLMRDTKVAVPGESATAGGGSHIPLAHRQLEPCLDERIQKFDAAKAKALEAVVASQEGEVE
eukprot:gene27671-7312_t